MSVGVWERFSQIAAARRGATAISQGDNRLSFAALHAAARGVAPRLARAGLEPGERCVIWAANSVELAIAILGVIAARGVPAVVHSESPPAHFQRAAALTGAKLALVDDEQATKTAFEGRTIVLASLVAGAEAEGDATLPLAPPATDPASIFFTSGSTGAPKGATQSHANLVWGADAVADMLGLGPEDRILCAIPWAFDYGWGQLLTTFLRGATQILPEGRASLAILEAIERERPTVLPAVPSLFANLIRGVSPIRDADRSSIRLVTNTGSKIPPTLWTEILELFPKAAFSLNYGLTETYRSASLPLADARTYPEAVGYAPPGAALAVIGDDGAETLPGAVGEIVHRGMGVFLGYWGEPERTAEARRPDPLWRGDGVQPAPAVFTGDLGWKDETGRLFVTGRRDRQIKSMGARVSPDEVERLIEATGLVAEVAVIARPHEILGEQVVAVFAPKTPGENPLRELKRAARETMSPFMRPMDWITLAALPRTPSAKIDYPALTARFQEPARR